MAPDAAVSDRIRTALAAHLKRDVGKIGLHDDLRKDLGLDSLAMIELLFKIEETFDLEIPNEDLSQITTVGDVIAYVERRLGMAAALPAPAPAVASAPVVKIAAASPARPAAKPAPKRAVARKKGSRRA
jgi:acyl carrier protein